jgi:hypothetical protein
MSTSSHNQTLWKQKSLVRFWLMAGIWEWEKHIGSIEPWALGPWDSGNTTRTFPILARQKLAILVHSMVGGGEVQITSSRWRMIGVEKY